MMRKQFAPLLVCAVVLLATAPARALAQTVAQSSPASGGSDLSDARATPKPALKAAFAAELARAKAGTATEADIERLEKARLDPRSTQQSNSGYTRKQKILVGFIVGAIVVLTIVVALTSEKSEHPTCDEEPLDTECIP